MISLTVPLSVALHATAETEGFLTELGAQVEMRGGLIHDHTVRLRELSPALFERYDWDIGELFTRSKAVRDEIFSQRSDGCTESSSLACHWGYGDGEPGVAITGRRGETCTVGVG
ncbi:hypothetical protein Tco_0335925 [Tanacetum coccineum]